MGEPRHTAFDDDHADLRVAAIRRLARERNMGHPELLALAADLKPNTVRAALRDGVALRTTAERIAEALSVPLAEISEDRP